MPLLLDFDLEEFQFHFWSTFRLIYSFSFEVDACVLCMKLEMLCYYPQSPLCLEDTSREHCRSQI
jgi:hypothetical protein